MSDAGRRWIESISIFASQNTLCSEVVQRNNPHPIHLLPFIRSPPPHRLHHIKPLLAIDQIKHRTLRIRGRNPDIAHHAKVPTNITPTVALANIPMNDILPVRAVDSFKRNPAFEVLRKTAQFRSELRLDLLRYIPRHEPPIVPFTYRRRIPAEVCERRQLAAGDTTTSAGPDIAIFLIHAQEGVSLARGRLAGRV